MNKLKIAALAIFATATMHAQDLKTTEVPSNLMTNFQKAYANATDVEWELKGTDYKVEFEVNRMEHDIYYSKDGAIIKSKIEISENQLPSTIAAAIKTKYPDFKIEDIEVTEINGIKTYEVELEKGWTTERKVVFDASGKVMSDLED